MPGISFQPWKARKVEAGESRTTIRKRRSRPFLVGETLRCWQNQRSPKRRYMGTVRVLETHTFDVFVAHVAWAEIKIGVWPRAGIRAELNGVVLRRDEIRRIAVADGFSSEIDLLKFLYKYYGRAPFLGNIIAFGALAR